MSGHSKWAGIKHKKAANDAKRGKIFSKIIKELTIASRIGGGDPSGNPRLRLAMDKAKEANMPNDNVKKAIQRGTGEIPGISYEEFVYEGYGPGGVALIVEVTTDNKNRSSSEIRSLFSKHGGNMGEAGCVGWMFNKKGVLTVNKKNYNEDELMELVINAGAEDFKSDDEEVYEIITEPESLETVKKVLTDKNIAIESAEITRLPQTYIKLEGKQAEQMLRLMDALDNSEDVQNIFANFDIPKEILDKIEG